ncbi:hypothetical protein FAES_0626 [Fibrella aestuarina BUZ 2]|uniref:Uncharacterized protein n=1 Tax=Fibrella aestuarina BUZ 2 TaxID=1166018 RepID=I0K3D4_9BACT|nr:hypothetical protein FAES_0626 [Fibrella aestuarina BUZ 2]
MDKVSNASALPIFGVVQATAHRSWCLNHCPVDPALQAGQGNN